MNVTVDSFCLFLLNLIIPVFQAHLHSIESDLLPNTLFLYCMFSLRGFMPLLASSDTSTFFFFF